MKWMKEKYKIEFVNIIDGTFVAQKESVLEELAPLYAKEINLPFFCDSTVFCLTQRKAELLKQMGCVCINMGIESGNEEYRRKYMDRTMTNKKIIDTFLMARKAGLDTRGYNIIGLPYQTREDIMETIELNRKCKVGSISLSIFMPYEGTKLREFCIKEKLISPEQEIIGDGTLPIIKNPYLSDKELMRLYNTFALYVVAPRELFPVIKFAESIKMLRKILIKEIL